MATINNIKKRANDIKNAYEPESVTAEKVGSLFEDIANVTEQVITSSEEVMQESVRASEQAAQAAEDASGYLSHLEEAIEALPDGQAVSAQVAETVVDLANYKDEVKDTYGEYQEAPEYLNVATDSDGRILESTNIDGRKTFAKDVEVQGKIINEDYDHVSYIVNEYIDDINSNEWAEVTLDDNNRVVKGVRKDGTQYFFSLDSPTIRNVEKDVAELKRKPSIDGAHLIGAIVWDAQNGNQAVAPSATQEEPANHSGFSWLSWKIFNDMKTDATVVAALPDIVNYNSWQRYLWDKTIDANTGLGVKTAPDNSIYEMFREDDTLFEVIDDFILRKYYGIDTSQTYTRPDRMLLQSPRKPLMAITKEMLGDDATVNDDIMNSDNVILDEHGEYAGINMGGWCFSGYPDVVYKSPVEYDAEGNKVIDHVDMKCNERMVAQIDLAAHNGIDFFCFYIEFNAAMLSESFDSDYIHLKMKSAGMNNSLFQFLEAPNNYKMKFCVMPGNTLNAYSLDGGKMNRLFKWISDKLFTHPCYLHQNGRPVVQIYEARTGLAYDEFLHHNGSYLLYNNGSSACVKIDGKYSYNVISPVVSQVTPYQILANHNLDTMKDWANYSSVVMMPAAMGKDDRPRYCYLTAAKGGSDSSAFEKPTKAEFIQQLKDVAALLDTSPQIDKVITVYAWDEYMEGGWLLPSQDEMEDETQGAYKLEAIREFKAQWR